MSAPRTLHEIVNMRDDFPSIDKADLAREVQRLRAALRNAQLYSECPCCMELVACVDECEHEANATSAYADLQWRREHNAEIDAALAESEKKWPE